MAKTTQEIIDLCCQGAAVNRSGKFRKGNVLHLPAQGRLVVTGDLHGHRRNFERIVKAADLAAQPDTHLILQEIIHGGPQDEDGGCLSFELLADVIAYQLEFPRQVHILMGNHDTSFITDSDVSKGGQEMNASMKAAMSRRFGNDYEHLYAQMRDYLLSLPLAARTNEGLWMSHSLPADRYLEAFDPEIFNRSLQPDDLVRPGSAYLLTWGRRHSDDCLRTMAELVDAKVFILGHQSQPQGWAVIGGCCLILASDHNHGCLMDLDLSQCPPVEQLQTCIVPISSIE